MLFETPQLFVLAGEDVNHVSVQDPTVVNKDRFTCKVTYIYAPLFPSTSLRKNIGATNNRSKMHFIPKLVHVVRDRHNLNFLVNIYLL